MKSSYNQLITFPMNPKVTLKRRYLVSFYFVLLILSFSHNIFRISTDNFQDFQWDSEDLVISRMIESRKHGIFSHASLLGNAPEGRKEGIKAYTPYFSQFGLQGLISGALQPNSSGTIQESVARLRSLNAIAFAAVLLPWIDFAYMSGGWAAGLLLTLLFSCSDWMVLFSRNLYWSAFLLLLPSSTAWIIYPQCKSLNRRKLYFGAIALLVMLKCLCGYEYVSNVILGATVAPVYFGMKSRKTVNNIFTDVVKTTIAGIVGFGMALAIHTAQLGVYSGSISSGMGIIFERAAARTYGQSHTIDPLPPNVPIFPHYKKYLSLTAVSFPKSHKSFSVYAIWIMFSLFGSLLWTFNLKNYARIKDNLKHLWLTGAYALTISLSWALLARGHMYFHLHINGIIFYLPGLVLIYLFLSIYFASGLHSFPPKKQAPSMNEQLAQQNVTTPNSS